MLYAYVDSYKLDSGAEIYCPTEVHPFEKSRGGTAKPVPTGTLATFEATYKQALPSLTCDKTYVAATVTRAVRPRGIRTDTMRSARIAVFINSDGSVARSFVYTSSGVDYLDTLALDAANRAAYRPSEFLCTPVVGEFLCVVDFEP
ncbi:MAG TPA: energy transducer TonB [Candidatus Tumulicola sp.]